MIFEKILFRSKMLRMWFYLQATNFRALSRITKKLKNWIEKFSKYFWKKKCTKKIFFGSKSSEKRFKKLFWECSIFEGGPVRRTSENSRFVSKPDIKKKKKKKSRSKFFYWVKKNFASSPRPPHRPLPLDFGRPNFFCFLDVSDDFKQKKLHYKTFYDFFIHYIFFI